MNAANNHVNGISYDSAGNVTGDNMFNTWGYDAEGHPTSVAGYTYVYDGLGNRVAKSGGSYARMYWPGPDGKVLNETDLAGNILIRNVYLNGNLVARRESNGNIHFPSVDHLGSSRIVANGSGAVEDDVDFYPFGGQIVHSYSSGNLYQFTADETDNESSSYHTAFRQMSPSLGRWLRPDPYDGSYDISNPQSLNRYSYALNSPLIIVDRSGLYCEYADDANDGLLEAVDYDSSQDECSGTGGTWYPDGWGSAGSGVDIASGVDVSSGVGISGGNSGEGSAGGASAGVGTTAPNNTNKQSTRQCADDIANHFSISGLLPGAPGLQNTFVGGLFSGFLGNNISNFTGVYNTFTGQTSLNNLQNSAGTFLGAGTTLGLASGNASAGAQGPLSILIGHFAPTLSSALGEAYAPKFIFDAALYGASLSYCKTGKY